MYNVYWPYSDLTTYSCEWQLFMNAVFTAHILHSSLPPPTIINPLWDQCTTKKDFYTSGVSETVWAFQLLGGQSAHTLPKLVNCNFKWAVSTGFVLTVASVAQIHLATYSAFSFCYILYSLLLGAWSSVVVKVLCYKPEGRGFETRWGEWISSIYLIFPATLCPGVYSAPNRNEYQKQKNNVSGEYSMAGA
jgi:hypothetical protein